MEGLHALGVQTHDGQTVEAQISAGDLLKAAHVRAAADGAVEALLQGIFRDYFAGHAENGTHKWHLRFLGDFRL